MSLEAGTERENDESREGFQSMAKYQFHYDELKFLVRCFVNNILRVVQEFDCRCCCWHGEWENAEKDSSFNQVYDPVSLPLWQSYVFGKRFVIIVLKIVQTVQEYVCRCRHWQWEWENAEKDSSFNHTYDTVWNMLHWS